MLYEMYTIILLVIAAIQTHARTENRWEDPHSLDGNIHYRDNCACESTDAPREVILSHYQRTLNLLLKPLKYSPEGGTYKTRLTIDLPADEYNFIKGFSGRAVIDVDEWNKLDGILTRIYTKPSTDEYMEVFMSWRDMFVFYFYSKEALITSMVLVSLVVVYNLLNARIKTWTVFKYFLLVLFLIDFGFVWIRLLQEVEVEKMVNSLKYKSMPAECDPNKMGFFQFLRHTFNDDNSRCKEYHNAMFADDLWKVNPLKVFGTQMGDLIQTPANAFGTAFGQFTTAILGCMNWYMAPLMPVVLLFVILIICIMLSFLTKTSFGFNFLYLIQFNFGKGERESVDDVISGKHLKTIMQFMQNKSPSRKSQHTDALIPGAALSSVQDIPRDETPMKQITQGVKVKPVKSVTFVEDDQRKIAQVANKQELAESVDEQKVTQAVNKQIIAQVANEQKKLAESVDKQRVALAVTEDATKTDEAGLIEAIKKTDKSDELDCDEIIDVDGVDNSETERDEIFMDDDSVTCSDDDIEVIEDCGDADCKCRPRASNDGKTAEAKASGDHF